MNIVYKFLWIALLTIFHVTAAVGQSTALTGDYRDTAQKIIAKAQNDK
jgi:hypothetical protein